jgi:hypothetical protein
MKDTNFVLVKEKLNLGSKGKVMGSTLVNQEGTVSAEQQRG